MATGSWRLNDIELHRVDRATVRNDWHTFRLAATASFIETGSDLYASNLARFFAGDDELVRWLEDVWEPEELQHGAALRAYVTHCWPEFDWPSRYRAFRDEYARCCVVPALEPTRTLELAARCIVEMGTSALYGAIQRCAREPVFGRLAGRIYADEVRHYKHFYRHFRRYRRTERPSRARVARTIVARLVAIRAEDGRCAYRHVWDFVPGRAANSFATDYRAFGRDLGSLLQRYAAPEMLARMTLKPLALPPRVVAVAAQMSAPLYRLVLTAGR
jgi:hypothetical protein